MNIRRLRFEAIVAIYLVVWIPSIALMRGLALVTLPGFAGPLTGLQIMPVLTVLTTLGMWTFIGLSGWWRDAHCVRIAGVSIPVPTGWRLVGACAASLLALATPLSFMFPGVSIPFIQLLMKGGVLIIAPIVDLLTRRRVHWYSWIALLLTLAGLTVTIAGRNGFNLPLLCVVVVGAYIFGYFFRLAAMSRVAKTDDPVLLKRYFVEEQVAAWPLSLALGALLIVSGSGPVIDQLTWGARELWTSWAFPLLAVIAAGTTLLGLLSMLILLAPKENTFCVPLERSASVLGGLGAAYLLTAIFGAPPPTGPELIGAAFLIAAVVVLSLGSRAKPSRAAEPAIPKPQVN